jgi:hypothetical protein
VGLAALEDKESWSQ